MNAAQTINTFLEARRRGEFETVAAPPADRVHTRELLEAAGLEPTRHNLMWLRRYMTAIGWKPAGNFRIAGRQGQGYARATGGQPTMLQIRGEATPDQLAVLFGLPLPDVKQAIVQGAPTRPARFVAWYVAQREEMMREGQGLAAAAARNLEALTRLRELKIEDMEDRLVPVGEVVAYLDDAFNVIRQRFPAVGSQVPGLSGEQRQALCAAIADSVADLRGDRIEDWKRTSTEDNDEGDELEFG